MDWNAFFQSKYPRGGACAALIAAILLTLLLPGMGLTEVQPESPLTGNSVRDITVLRLGESTRQSDVSLAPSGGRTETPEQDQDNSETQPRQRPETMQPDPSTEDGSDGQEDDNQGVDGGELSPAELSMVLTWYPDGAGAKSVSCAPDKTQQLSVDSYALTDGLFRFSVSLTGTLAQDGEITEGHCIAESDQTERELRWPNGTLLMSPAAGGNEETYNLSFTVRTGDRNVFFRYRIVYRVLPDVQLTFSWLEGRVQHELQPCKPEGSVSAKIKNSQLSGGFLPYELKLTGRDAANARIWSVGYTSAASGGSLTAPKGSLPMETPPGETSNTYTIAVGVIANSQSYHYKVVLYFGNDVTLQMRYTLSDGGQRTVFCENKRAKTADTVYDDQLVDGLLNYELSIAGEDAGSVTITSVKCRRSGDGNKTTTIAESGQIALLPDKGKTGQNEFTVEAEDGSGNRYAFSINIPYKHKGTESVEIAVDPDETHELINDTKNNLTVAAWSDYTGQREYIRATGTDTILRVVLDGVEITYTSTSGSSSEYDLYPANPETGDMNTHTLRIYAEDAYGNWGEKTLVYTGRRRESGQKIGEAQIYVDMTVLGAGMAGPIHYDVLADEPVSYVIAKAIMGMDTGEPFGKVYNALGWPGDYGGTLDTGFYLRRLDTDRSADALEGGAWPGSTEEEVLAAIDARFGKGTGLASLWRCLYRNGLNKSTGSGSSFGEFDYTSGSGWMYALNGAYYPGQAMSAVHLKDGDVLTLRYTLAYGWDVGGGNDNYYGNIVGYCAKAVNGYIEVSHQMEMVEDPDGSIHYVCHCCGLIEDCTHEHTTYKDLGDGTHVLFCEDCKTAVGDPQSHNWTYAAENTEDNHVCTECGAVENHFWKEADGSNTATCTEPGVRRVTCSVCGMEREEEAPAKGHTLDNRWNYTALDHYQRCSTCGEALNHGSHEYEADFGDYACRICNAIHEEECGGEPVLREATCQKKVSHCDSCGYDLTEYGVFEEYHDYVEGFCRYCGAQDPDYVPHTHDYRETGRVEPTCTEDGYIEYACDCGDTYQETLPAPGHTWGEWTPTEDGRQVRYCQICGAEEWAEIRMSFMTRLFRRKF